VTLGLQDLVESAYCHLFDTDCANPDDSSQKIWIAQGAELELAQREFALSEIKGNLQATIRDPDVLDLILDQVRQAPLPSETQDRHSDRSRSTMKG
tara:strand:- start:1309 stop:1596 length:288 start_codon:yes stop_codon:yes gene_type:complete